MSEPPQNDTDRSREPDEAPPDEQAPAGPRWHARLKHRLQARVIVVADAGIAALQGFKTRAGAQEETGAERRRDSHALEPERAVEAPAPKRRLRRFLIQVMLMLIAGIIGMSFSYRLLSTMLTDQVDRIRAQRDELRADNLADQEKAAQLAKIMKSLDAEHARRIELEQRLSEPAAQGPKADTPPNEAGAEDRPPAQKQELSRSGAVAAPSQASTFSPSAPQKTGNCDLTAGGNSPDALKHCIDAFNRN